MKIKKDEKVKLMRQYGIKLLVLFLLLTSWSTVLMCQDKRDLYSDTRENIHLYGEVYKKVVGSYVEPVDPEAFMRAGIDGMMNALDPYTIYLKKEAQENIELMTKGKYYGVGMRITVRNGWPTCAEQPFPNSPAQKASIREGDKIIEIDGESTKNLSLTETASRLRGEEKGSKVRIKIRRVGVEEPISITLIRDEIVISVIQYKGMVEPGIGLINVNVFNRGAGEQVKTALEELLDQGMESLILDLRGNPGGLLDVAVNVLSNFFDDNTMVVYTKGRNQRTDQEYRTEGIPIFANKPLIVLVDQYSASASEIVSGAIQDLDRGVVIGHETFGKGLVQNVIPLDRKGRHQLKMTTAKYYLPSGRLIQRSDVFKRNGESVLLDPVQEDSIRPVYTTENGRQVYGGGGIRPDIEIDNEKLSRYVSMLRFHSLFFNFSLRYAADHNPTEKDFTVDKDMLDTFFTFVDTSDFEYSPEGMAELDSLETIARRNGFYEQFEPQIEILRDKFQSVESKERSESINDIKFMIKQELAAKWFGNDASYVTRFERDEVIKKAIDILKNEQEYQNQIKLNIEN
ncbi:MAG: S41 family peptidase [candidate division KSB1 bacterium]|nr:S41 family peptidase [candidate division KSB1 bacterium]